MLSSGKEMDIESAEKAGRLRYDDLACGKFAVGRHAQVLFDGGMWYVGVVAKLHVDMHAEPTAAVMLFEGNFFPAALCTWTCVPGQLLASSSKVTVSASACRPLTHYISFIMCIVWYIVYIVILYGI
jgi:hypothetical protein